MDGSRDVSLAQPSAAHRETAACRFRRTAWNAVVCVITIGLLLLTAALVGVRLVGFTPYPVLMTSAAPDYRVGDLLYVYRTDFADIQTGDAITYVTAGDLTVVTRRVLAVDYDRRQVSTGDTAPVEEGSILGVVVFSVPWLGRVSAWLTGSTAKYTAAALLAVLLSAVLAEYGRTRK